MAHVKKLDEFYSRSAAYGKRMNENLYEDIEKYMPANVPFINLITSMNDEDDDKFGLTLEGIIALYRHFYSTDIDFFLEFVGNIDEKSDFLNGYDGHLDFMQYVKVYFAYKLLEDVSEDEVINAVVDEEYTNYLGSSNDMFNVFRSNQQEEWADGIRAELKKLRGE